MPEILEGNQMKETYVMKIDQVWEKWTECLGKQDRNSIINQITSLIWDSGIYRLLLECRQISIDQEKSHPKINYFLHKLLTLIFLKDKLLQFDD